MRFAISAVAAVSGVVLLGLAFYGQPALYLHEAGEQWAALVGDPAAHQPADPDSDDAVANRMTQLQQQVAQLKQELAAAPVRPAASSAAPAAAAAPDQTPQVGLRADPAGPPASAPAAGPVAATPDPVQRLSAAASAAPSQLAEPSGGGSGSGSVAVPQPLLSDPNGLGQSKPEASKIDLLKAEQRRAAARGPKPELAKPTPLRPDLPNPALKIAPPKSEVAAADAFRPEGAGADAATPDARRADPVGTDKVGAEIPRPPLPQPEAATPAPLRIDPVVRELPKPEPAKPGPQKLAAVRVAPPPPPALQPEPSRREPDDAQSVLSRLRQFDPGPARQTTPSVDSRTGPVVSPMLPRLAAARNALAGGQIEDARRLLQETQLQLVFRPIDAAGDDSPRAGRSAADVAHSLEALSANNIPLSRRYIDRAADDLSDKGGGVPVQEPDMRKTGYAPAYPPR